MFCPRMDSSIGRKIERGAEEGRGGGHTHPPGVLLGAGGGGEGGRRSLVGRPGNEFF